MSKYLEKAEKIRAIVEPHHNCAQSVLMALSEATGMDDKTAYDVAANFGGGMKCGSVCGAITGALMAMGLCGKADPADVKALFNEFKKNHEDKINCFELLEINKREGGDKKAHCDALVYECVKLAENIINK